MSPISIFSQPFFANTRTVFCPASDAAYTRLCTRKTDAERALYGLMKNSLAVGNYPSALAYARRLDTENTPPEIRSFIKKLEKHCNEMEKSAQ